MQTRVKSSLDKSCVLSGHSLGLHVCLSQNIRLNIQMKHSISYVVQS